MSGHRFQKINIEISNICNLQCSFCPEVVRTKGMMDISLFQHIIGEVRDLTDQVCLHLMGDPLVHARLSDMIQVCEQAQVKIFLVTNGTLLRADKVDALLSPAIRQINFSLHSFPDNYPDQDPGPYLERIFQFTERALRERPDLYINYRLWNLAMPEGTDKKNQDMLSRIEQRFSKKINTDINVKKYKSAHVLGRLYVHFDTEFVWPALNLPVLGIEGTCQGLRNHFGILVDGTVVPCCLDKEAAIPLGNIRKKPILEILSSDRAKKMKLGFEQGKLIEDLCQRCQYIERFQGKVKKAKARQEKEKEMV